MGNFIDFTGKSFGRLVVIGLAGKDIKNRYVWKVKCECGVIKNVPANVLNVKSGSLSCGCLRLEKTKGIWVDDITGSTFGRWTVINYESRSRWNCICSCGKRKLVLYGTLINGKSKSCGCWHRELCGLKNGIDLTGNKYGKLTVIKKINKTSRGHTKWLCECDCGNETVAMGVSMKDGSTVSCGCKKESLVATELKQYFCENYSAISEYKCFINPETNRYLPYDIYLPNENIFIEVQGEQHYREDNNWNTIESFKYRKHKDRLKKKYARKNGIFVEIDLRNKNFTVEDWIDYIEDIISEAQS